MMFVGPYYYYIRVQHLRSRRTSPGGEQTRLGQARPQASRPHHRPATPEEVLLRSGISLVPFPNGVLSVTERHEDHPVLPTATSQGASVIHQLLAQCNAYRRGYDESGCVSREPHVVHVCPADALSVDLTLAFFHAGYLDALIDDYGMMMKGRTTSRARLKFVFALAKTTYGSFASTTTRCTLSFSWALSRGSAFTGVSPRSA